ncbi:MAG: hypothetical protein KKF56_03800 [Nanoarchaeota archaeon]|nr:hypothetical protein [Nanoarchaeota archaeon]
MVGVEELPANITNYIPESVLHNIDFLITMLQALGIIILAYLVFNVISLIMQRKRLKELKEINQRLIRIEKKLKISKN